MQIEKNQQPTELKLLLSATKAKVESHEKDLVRLGQEAADREDRHVLLITAQAAERDCMLSEDLHSMRESHRTAVESNVAELEWLRQEAAVREKALEDKHQLLSATNAELNLLLRQTLHAQLQQQLDFEQAEQAERLLQQEFLKHQEENARRDSVLEIEDLLGRLRQAAERKRELSEELHSLRESSVAEL